MAVWFAGRRDVFSDLAADVAEARGEEVYERLEAVPDGPVICVCGPSPLTESDVLRLQKRLLDETGG